MQDLATGQCTLESVGPAGASGNGESVSPGISQDGRYVVFESAAGNLIDPQFQPGVFHVFLRDREKGTTRLLTTNANGEPANNTSGNPAISADGTAVAFESVATDLIVARESGRTSVGIYSIQLGSGLRARLDVTSAGGLPVGPSASPAISADGRFVAFVSKTDLTCGQVPACATEPSDTNAVADIYLRDARTNMTRRVTRSATGGDPDGPSYDPAISGDGRHLTFVSEASNLTRDHIKRAAHVYVHDLATGISELVSRNPTGQPGNGPSLHPTLSYRRFADRVSVPRLQSCLRRQMPGPADRHQSSLGRLRVRPLDAPHGLGQYRHRPGLDGEQPGAFTRRCGTRPCLWIATSHQRAR